MPPGPPTNEATGTELLSKAKHWHAVMSEVPFKTSTPFKKHDPDSNPDRSRGKPFKKKKVKKRGLIASRKRDLLALVES